MGFGDQQIAEGRGVRHGDQREATVGSLARGTVDVDATALEELRALVG